MFDSLSQDLRFALRQLRHRPGLAAGAVLTLGLGIGANGAIFSVVKGVLLQPLAYDAPRQLAAVWHWDLDENDFASTSIENYMDWRAQTPAFQDMAALARSSAILMTEDAAVRLPGARVTTNTLRVLGVAPSFGRDFLEEDIDGSFVIISHGLFTRAFGGDSSRVGETVRLSGRDFELIGVAPPGFRTPFFPEAEFWVPMGEQAGCGRGCWFARVVGRLSPGASMDVALAELDVVAERLAEEYPDDNANVRIAAIPLQDEIVGHVKPALLVLLAGVGLVLLIACVNVANLLLARAIAREREMAVRAAVGASRKRIARQLLTESVVLALVSGAAGVYVAYLAVDALLALSPPDLPRLEAVSLDGAVLAAMTAVAVATGLLFGLVPALHASRSDPGGTLASDRSVAGRQSAGRLRDALVVTQVTLALALLVGAGLLLKSFITLIRVDPGFDTEGLLTAETQFMGQRYGESPARIAFYEELFSRLEARPGITGAAGVWLLPITEQNVVSSLEVEGRSDVAQANQPTASMRAVTEGYFETMRIPLIAGRRLSRADDLNARRVIVVSASLARSVWPGEDPIGRRIRFGLQFEDPEPWREVVGVVGDVKLRGLDDRDLSVAYIPYRQFTYGSLSVVLRTNDDPTRLAAPFRDAVRSIDPQVAVYDIDAMDRIVAGSLASQRFFMLLLLTFAAVAAALACVGIYAVTSYSVSARTREMGIRIASGARATDVQRLVLIRAAGVTAVGVGLGALAAFALSRFMTSLLFETSPLDPIVFSGVAMLLAAVTLFAAWLPARRAARVEPMVALRADL